MNEWMDDLWSRRGFGGRTSEIEAEKMVLDDGSFAFVVLSELIDLGGETFDLLRKFKVSL